MKKIFKTLIAILPALVAVACTEAPEETPVTNNGELKEITLKVTPDVITKTIYTDGAGLHWDAENDGTKFGVADNTNGSHISTAIAVAGDGTATITCGVAAGATKIYPIYPKLDNLGVNEGCATAYFPIHAAQTQAVAGIMESGDGKLAMTTAEPLEVTEGSNTYNAKMVNHSAIARFIIYSTSGVEDKVKSVKFEAVTAERINGKLIAICNWNDAAANYYYGAEGNKSTTVTLDTAYDLNGINTKENAKGIYMGVIPGTVTGYSYTITTDKGTYVFSTESAKEFKSNTINNIFLNLDNAEFTSNESGEGNKEVIFTYGNPNDCNLPADGSGRFLNGALVSLTVGGEAITIAADLVNHLTIVTEGGEGWLNAKFENTNNFQLDITAEKNKTTSVRSAKVYLAYDGIKSTNYITVNQDAGTGAPTVIPTLTKNSEESVVAGGATVTATLTLNVDGVEVSGADVDTYMTYVALSGSHNAEVSQSAGVVSIVVPANTTASTRNITVTATTEDDKSSITIAQEAGEGSGDSAFSEYSWEVSLVGGRVWGTAWGFGGGDANTQTGHYLSVSNITHNGTPVNFANTAEDLELAQSIAEYAFRTSAPTDEEKASKGQSAKTGSQFGIKAFYCYGQMIQVAWVLTDNQTISKTTGYDATGNEVGSVIVWVD